MDHSKNSTGDSRLETLGFPSQVFFVSLYSVTALCAFASNLITIVVLIKGRRCTRDLRKFLINLSVTDLLMSLFTIPFTYTNYMFGRWIFWPIMCSIVNMAQLTTITVSIFTLVAIAIDRYFAIMHPLQRSISWFKSHRALIVLVIWIFGITIGLTQIWVSKTGSFVFEGVTYNSCGERWLPESLEGQIYTGFIFTVTFALPMAILSVVYSAMGCRLLRYRMPGQLLAQSQHYGGSGNSLRSPEQSDLFAEGGQPANGQQQNGSSKVKSTKSNNCALCSKSNKGRLLLTVPNGGGGSLHQHNSFATNEQRQQHKSNNKESEKNAEVTAEQKIPERQSTEKAAAGAVAAAALPQTNMYSELDNEVEKGSGRSNETTGGKKQQKRPCHMGDSQSLSQASFKTEKFPLPKINEFAVEKQFSKSATTILNGHCPNSTSTAASSTTGSANYRLVGQTNTAVETLLPSSSSSNLAPAVKRKVSTGAHSNSNGASAAQQQHQHHHHHSNYSHHNHNHHNHSTHKIINIRRNKVLKMLITIIGVFTLCWLPIQIFNILTYFVPNFLAASSPTKYYCFVFSYFFCHWISCAHSMLNPLIYSFMSKNFRDDVKSIFGRFWHLYILRKDHFRVSAYSSQQQHYLKQQQQQNYVHNNAHPQHHHPSARMLHNSVASPNNNNHNLFGASYKDHPNNLATQPGSNSQSQFDSASSPSLPSQTAQAAAATTAHYGDQSAQSPSTLPPLTPLTYQLSSNSSSSSSSSSSASSSAFSSLSRPKSAHQKGDYDGGNLEALAETTALLITTSTCTRPNFTCTEVYSMHQTEVHLVSNGSAVAAAAVGKEIDGHTSI